VRRLIASIGPQRACIRAPPCWPPVAARSDFFHLERILSTLATRFLLAATLAAWAARAGAAPAKAVGRVCQAKEGSAESETVKAARASPGVAYAFRSTECAGEFEAAPAAYVPSESPKHAPALHVRDLRGARVGWKDLRGKVVLLDFWATWCLPCRRAMPELQKLHDKYQARGFLVLGVSIDEDGEEKVKRFVAAKRITYPIALDSEDDPTWDAFKVTALPASFLVDGQGRIVARWTGTADLAEVEAKLQTILGKSD
jgi:thiol-disulfide isomerase/thioredoxin